MQYKWLNMKKNKNLIVFFNGWGMDEKVVENLSFDDFDVLTFYDYRTFEMHNFDFSVYEKKYLIAWSMGVYVCNLFYDKFKDFNGLTAINGTECPVDDNLGIPVMAYNMTIDNFNEMTCKKFMKKISTTVDLLNYCSRSVQELKQELISIRNLKIEKFLHFNKVILSTKDRIFPIYNMLTFWKNKKTDIKQIESSHYIFDRYTKWSELI